MTWLAMQNQEYRYGVTYTPDYYTVNYTSHNIQTFLANESCAGCTLDDNVITVNRSAYILWCLLQTLPHNTSML